MAWDKDRPYLPVDQDGTPSTQDSHPAINRFWSTKKKGCLYGIVLDELVR